MYKMYTCTYFIISSWFVSISSLFPSFFILSSISAVTDTTVDLKLLSFSRLCSLTSNMRQASGDRERNPFEPKMGR